MRNPIFNLIQTIEPSDLKVCNRCGCTDLAWVKFKSGKWALVHTTTSRPGYNGEYEAPHGLWAVKTAYHICSEYKAKKDAETSQIAAYQAAIDDKKIRSEWCHPNADTPTKIINNAFLYLYKAQIAEFKVVTPLFQETVEILANAGNSLDHAYQNRSK